MHNFIVNINQQKDNSFFQFALYNYQFSLNNLGFHLRVLHNEWRTV